MQQTSHTSRLLCFEKLGMHFGKEIKQRVRSDIGEIITYPLINVSIFRADLTAGMETRDMSRGETNQCNISGLDTL